MEAWKGASEGKHITILCEHEVSKRSINYSSEEIEQSFILTISAHPDAKTNSITLVERKKSLFWMIGEQTLEELIQYYEKQAKSDFDNTCFQFGSRDGDFPIQPKKFLEEGERNICELTVYFCYFPHKRAEELRKKQEEDSEHDQLREEDWDWTQIPNEEWWDPIELVTEKSNPTHYLCLTMCGNDHDDQETVSITGDLSYGLGRVVDLWQRAKREGKGAIEVDDYLAVCTQLNELHYFKNFMKSRYPLVMRKLSVRVDEENSHAFYVTVKKRQREVIWIMGREAVNHFLTSYENGREYVYDRDLSLPFDNSGISSLGMHILPKMVLEKGEKNIARLGLYFCDERWKRERRDLMAKKMEEGRSLDKPIGDPFHLDVWTDRDEKLVVILADRYYGGEKLVFMWKKATRGRRATLVLAEPRSYRICSGGLDGSVEGNTKTLKRLTILSHKKNPEAVYLTLRSEEQHLIWELGSKVLEDMLKSNERSPDNLSEGKMYSQNFFYFNEDGSEGEFGYSSHLILKKDALQIGEKHIPKMEIAFGTTLYDDSV